MRTCNLYDMEQFRRPYSNALFNNNYRSFDLIFRKIDISDQNCLFVNERIDGTLTDWKYYHRFRMSPIINNREKITEVLNKRKGIGFGNLCFLVGKRGVGKSTIIRRFFNCHINNYGGSKCSTCADKVDCREKREVFDDSKTIGPKEISIILDLLGMTTDAKNTEEYIWQKLYDNFKDTFGIKEYYNDIELAKKVVPIYSTLREVADSVWLKPLNYTKDLLAYVSKKKRIYIAIDNTDELGVERVEAISRIAYSIARDFPVGVIVSLRDYWDDIIIRQLSRQHMVSRHYLKAPKIEQVIKNRIKGLRLTKSLSVNIDYSKLDEERGGIKPDIRRIKVERIDSFFDKLIDKAFTEDSTISVKLFEMCNYDLREVLDNMYNFFHSCKLPLAPLFQRVLLDDETIREKIEFSDFLTCFFTIHTVCYDYKSSRLFNLFDASGKCESSDYRNTLCLIRILQRCSLGESQNKNNIINDFLMLGYEREFIINALLKLLRNGLIESTESLDLNILLNLTLSAKGIFYLNEMIYSFDYLSYIQDRVPMPSEYHSQITIRFGDPFATNMFKGSWIDRKSAVSKFIDFIEKEENYEYSEFGEGKDANNQIYNCLLRVRGGEITSIAKTMRNKYDEHSQRIEKRVKDSRFIDSSEIEIKEVHPVYEDEEPNIDHGAEYIRSYHDDIG